MGNSVADGLERQLNWVVAFFALSSLHLLLEASTYLVEAPMRDSVAVLAKWASRGGALCVVVAMLIAYRLQRRRGSVQKPALLDSYVLETIKRAATISFFVTVVVVGVLDIIANNTQQPADFFIKLVGFSLTAVFAIAFTRMNAFVATSSS